MPFFSETLHRGHLHRTPAGPDRTGFAEIRKLPRLETRTPTFEEIAKLAYSYWEARGRTHGSALEDWFRAERDLRSR